MSVKDPLRLLGIEPIYAAFHLLEQPMGISSRAPTCADRP
jgi:hypothetical protein